MAVVVMVVVVELVVVVVVVMVVVGVVMAVMVGGGDNDTGGGGGGDGRGGCNNVCFFPARRDPTALFLASRPSPHGQGMPMALDHLWYCSVFLLYITRLLYLWLGIIDSYSPFSGSPVQRSSFKALKINLTNSMP